MSVTATLMDCITEKSGHQMVPCAVSVCTTPAAPSPVPIPYPVVANSAEGVKDPPSRTKINGAKIITVGACFVACHGNEATTVGSTRLLARSCSSLVGTVFGFTAFGGGSEPPPAV